MVNTYIEKLKVMNPFLLNKNLKHFIKSCSQSEGLHTPSSMLDVIYVDLQNKYANMQFMSTCSLIMLK